MKTLFIPIRCQCNEIGYDHSRGNCSKRAQYAVLRNGQYIKVCGNCILINDKDITARDANGMLKPLFRVVNGDL